MGKDGLRGGVDSGGAIADSSRREASDDRVRATGKWKAALAKSTLKLISAVFMVACLAAILGLSYLMGHDLLEGALFGNDIDWALSLAIWYDRWVPDLPIWFPYQGAGTPLTVLHPPGASLLVVILHRLSGLTIVQALRLIGFLSVPLTSAGLYFLIWRKVRSQAAAFLGALFYLLSPASWYFLVQIALYAQSVSIMVVPWTFLLYDAYLSRAIQPSKPAGSLLERLVLPAGAFLLAVSFILHSATGLCLAAAIVGYAALLPFVHPSRPRLWPSVPMSLLRGILGVVVGLALASLWLVPLFSANALSDREGLSYMAWHSVSYFDFGATLSLLPPPDRAYLMTFAIPVVAFAAIGLIAGLVRRSNSLAWGALALSFLLFTAMPTISPDIVRVFEVLWSRLLDRPILITLVFLPAVAADGVYALSGALVRLPAFIAGRLQLERVVPSPVGKVMRSATTGLLTLAIGFYAVVQLEGRRWGRNGYGPPSSEGELPVFVDNQQLRVRNLPQYVLSSEGEVTYRGLLMEATHDLALTSNTRLDVSPNLGGITQALSLYSDASMINIYSYQVSVIHAMWGYQQGLFYGRHEGAEQEINELAKWLGIQYLFLHPVLDPIDNFSPLDWPLVFPDADSSQAGVEIRRFSQAPPMASLLRTPAVLVVGGYENAIYEQVFRTFLKGGVGFEDALLVEGTHSIDDYSLEEISRFDIVFLHGYGYRNRDRAWSLLERYVAEGGALYVDTGWQFYTPDWEMLETPSVLPVRSLEWTDLGMAEDFLMGDSAIVGDIQASDLSPLVWGDQPWGVSVSTDGLREWARPVLSVSGIPLVAAGQYGRGRVVWSGMNLVGHAFTYDNPTERELLRRLVEWLAPVPAERELTAPIVQRVNPDHIRFVLPEAPGEGTSLLWREAFSPDWHARVELDGRRVGIPIYRAGPGMMLLILPPIDTPGAVIEMDYSLGFVGAAGLFVSLVTCAALVVGVVYPRLWSTISGRFSSSRQHATKRGYVRWLPPIGSLPDDCSGPVSSPLKPEGPWQAPNPRAETVSPPWTPRSELVDDQQMESLWEAFRASRGSEPGEGEADQMIEWWRKTSRRQDGEKPSGGER